jgi:hypothetical protein
MLKNFLKTDYRGVVADPYERVATAVDSAGWYV